MTVKLYRLDAEKHPSLKYETLERMLRRNNGVVPGDCYRLLLKYDYSMPEDEILKRFMQSMVSDVLVIGENAYYHDDSKFVKITFLECEDDQRVWTTEECVEALLRATLPSENAVTLSHACVNAVLGHLSGGWNSVKDNPPAQEGRYLVKSNSGAVFIARLKEAENGVWSHKSVFQWRFLPGEKE